MRVGEGVVGFVFKYLESSGLSSLTLLYPEQWESKRESDWNQE
jgi:hypothetical protein